MLSRRPGMEAASPMVRSANVWMSSQACEGAPAKTVRGLEAPVGKSSFVCGRAVGRVVCCGTGTEGDGGEKGTVRKLAAKEGPVWDVPWRRIIVEVCVDVGAIMYGSGCGFGVVAIVAAVTILPWIGSRANIRITRIDKEG